MDHRNVAPRPDVERDDAHAAPSVVVHQATGMVVAQTGLSATDALHRLKIYAQEVSSPMDDVARDVVNRVISFVPDDDGQRSP
jgi:AmiR/NasT family two-component response regulator